MNQTKGNNQILSELFNSKITNLGFAINLVDKTIKFDDVIMKRNIIDQTVTYSGNFDDMVIYWTFEKLELGYIVTLSINSKNPINCISIDNLMFEVLLEENMKKWKVPMFGNNFINTGVKNVEDIIGCSLTSRATGIFEDMSKNGIMISQIIPLRHIFNCNVKMHDNKMLFSSSTNYPNDYFGKNIVSQSTWICDNCTPNEGMEFLSKSISKSKIRKKIIGWNSWDYYFTTVSHEDIIENIEFINGNNELKKYIEYIIIDDGWEYKWGEWENNHKFKNGMKYTADKIKENGFIPGIWTAPLQIDKFSYTALREYEMLVVDNYGDPFICLDTDNYLVDPTHPKGRKFISKLYKMLYEDGYRLFKVDFVNSVLDAKNFYNRDMGPYDVIRELFSIIRDSVSEESHILGCSLPAECGADIADSGRTGIDIHNCWTHVVWAVESLEWAHMYQNTIWNNDIDFLIVRGNDTSIERNTNVLNSKLNYHRLNKGSFDLIINRWRNGEDFNYYEAETWSNFVSLSGGNIILSDRLSKLNTKGLDIIINALRNQSKSCIKPYFQKGDMRASLWKSDEHIMLINWENKDKNFSIHLGLKDDTALISNKSFHFKNGYIHTKLRPHESIILFIQN